MIKNMSKAVVDMQASEQTSIRGYQLRASASTATNTTSLVSSFDSTAATRYPHTVATGTAPAVTLALNLATKINDVDFTSYKFAIDTPGTTSTGAVTATELILITMPPSFGLKKGKWLIRTDIKAAPTGVTLGSFVGFGSCDVSIIAGAAAGDNDILSILRYFPVIDNTTATTLVGGNMVIHLTQQVLS